MSLITIYSSGLVFGDTEALQKEQEMGDLERTRKEISVSAVKGGTLAPY